MAASFRNACVSVDFICSSSGVCVKTTRQLEAILMELVELLKREKEEKKLKSEIRVLKEEGDLVAENEITSIEEEQEELNDGLKQKEEMLAKYFEELEIMQQKAEMEFFFGEENSSRQRLDDEQLEKLNESQKRKLEREKEMNERAILAQKKADETMIKLVEELKREKEKAFKKITMLQRELDQKQALESKLTSLEKELKDKQQLDYINKLIIKHLQEVRTALLNDERVIQVQRKDIETMTKLVEDLKSEKEQSLEKINVLQRELDRKQVVEMEGVKRYKRLKN